MGRLIREGASTLTGSSGGSVAPADVTSLLAVLDGFSKPDTNGKRNARIRVSYTPPVAWTGKGVHIYIEAPDGSGSNPRSRLGVFTLGTSALAPEFEPFDAGRFPYDATNNTPAIIELDAPTETEAWRVYAVSYTTEIENTLKPATEVGAPPSTLVTVTPPGSSISGEEWAKNVTGFSASVEYDVSEAGDDVWRLVTAWTDPGDSRFAGSEIVIRPQGTSGDKDIVPSGVLAKGAQAWTSEWWAVGADLFFDVFCVSISQTNRGLDDPLRNTIVLGITPRVAGLSATKQLGPAGQERAPFVTDFTADKEYGVSEAGDETYRLYGSWTNPGTQTKFRGVKVVARPSGGTGSTDIVLAIETEGRTEFRTDPFPIPTGSNTLTIYAVSIDANNRANSITGSTPNVSLTIERQGNGSPGSGTEVAPNVIGFTASYIDGGLDEIGGQRYRLTGSWTLPGDVTRFRGVKIVLRPSGGTGSTDIVLAIETEGSTTFRTDAFPMPETPETYTLYAVSIDANNRANSMVAGTPSVAITLTPGVGQLKINRAALASFNTAEFETVGGTTFQAVEFAAQKIFVGSVLRVGGGFGASAPSFKGSNGQIAVYNASNALRAWMGQNGSIYGGWFGELYIGGTGPGTAPLYSTNAGVVVIGGNVTGTPYISLRNSSDIEVGRLGSSIDTGFHGAWFKQLRVGGSSISFPVIQSDASGNVTINGASFTVTSGSTTINIDATNKIKVTDTALTRGTEMTGSHFRVGKTTDASNFSEVALDVVTVSGASGLTRADLTPTRLLIGGNQVVGTRMAAVSAPTGGTVVDVEARAVINSLRAVLSFALGGHGLTA